MHLKKIDIFGFKSFADKTEAYFERGITCIVGPNGCGKSNISDAIRWVLGERSAKLLRGSCMEDVIFSGTEFRKPMGMAEVSLIIDNSDRKLAIGFDEVMVTRRLYRSGESEYLINKTPCRHKDIQDLILDTGIGSNSYSMIEQGRIDYILNAQEDERRFLIEEAAGISKYKVKKEEALRKLERTEVNLLRLNDIVSEVEKNIRYAERQAKRAEKYKEKLEVLKNLETQKALLEKEGLDQEGHALDEKRDRLREQIQKLESEIQMEESRFKDADTALSQMDAKSAELEKRKYELKLELAQLQNRIQTNLEKVQELKCATQEIEKESILAESHRKAFQEEWTQKESDLATLRAECERLQKAVAILSNDFSQARSQLSQRESRVREIQSQLFDFARETAEVKNRLHELEMNFQNEQTKKVKAQQIIERLKIEKDECLKRIENLSEETQVDGSYPQGKLVMSEKKSELLNKEAACRSLEKAIIQKKTEVKEIQSQVELFLELDKEGVFEDSSSNQILEESKKEGSVLHGMVKTFSEVMAIKKGYEGAIRAALADWANALIVQDHEQAIKILDFAMKAQAKELAIMINGSVSLAEDQHEIPHIEGMKGKAKEFMRVHPDYEWLVDELLRNVLVVEPLSKERLVQWASLANGFKIVSQDGFVLGPGLRIQYLGGLVKGEVVSHRKDIKALQGKISSLESQIEAHEKDLEVFLTQMEEAQSEMASLEKQALEAEIHHQSSYRLKQSLLSQVQRLEEEIALNGAEAEQSEGEMKARSNEKVGWEARLADLTQTENEHQKLLQDEMSALATLSGRKDQLSQNLAEQEKQWELSKSHERYQLGSLELLGKNQKSQESLQIKRQSQKESHGKLIREMESDTRAKDFQTKQLQVQIQSLESQTEEITEQRSSFAQTRSALYARLEEMKNHLNKAREWERDAQLKRMEIGYKFSTLTERMKQTYHIDLTTLDKSTFDLQNVSAAFLEAEIQVLKEKLESLGTVNLLAIEEYESLKQRYDFLHAQKQDLEKGREDLLEAIRKINRTTKKLFQDTFAQVQIAFREYFRALFGGGEAELILMDEANPLESGIDIVVRPPGKKNQQISLLSGGEKALTATALLFALFKIKPSPFCVLDEVDAPLDEANVHRFLDVVKGFLGATQFIVVTHNRKTIATADSLYGVTMEEAGVSKIVSVKLVSQADPSDSWEKSGRSGLNVVLN